jgi:lipoprotein-anchoring transpeptidase ErfK/SrfK
MSPDRVICLGPWRAARRLALILLTVVATCAVLSLSPADAATADAGLVASATGAQAPAAQPALALPDAPARLTAVGRTAVGRTGKWIEVILSKQRLIAWQNGRAVMSSAISSGLRRTPTRKGVFAIRRKYRSTRMTGPGYNLPRVPWTMYYSGSFAIHGAYWHNRFGTPMSHGCINLPVAFAGRLYAWAPVGTTVVIH